MLKTAVSVLALGQANALKLVPPARPPPSIQDDLCSRTLTTVDAPIASSYVHWEAAPVTPANLLSRPHSWPAVTHKPPLSRATYEPFESTKLLHRMAALTLHQMKLIQAQWLESLVDSEGYDEDYEDRMSEKWTAVNYNILMEMTLINLKFNALMLPENELRVDVPSVQPASALRAASPPSALTSSLMEVIPRESYAMPNGAAYELPLEQNTATFYQISLPELDGDASFESIGQLHEHDTKMEPEIEAAMVAEMAEAEMAAAEAAAAEAAAVNAAEAEKAAAEAAAAAERAAAKKATAEKAATALIDKENLTPPTAPEVEAVVPAAAKANAVATRAFERAAARAAARQAAQLDVEAARAKAEEAEVEVLATRATHAPLHRYRITLDTSGDEATDIPPKPELDETHDKEKEVAIVARTSLEETIAATAKNNAVEVEGMVASSKAAEGHEAAGSIATTVDLRSPESGESGESGEAASIDAPKAVPTAEAQAGESTTSTTAAAGVLAAEVLAVEAAIEAAVLMTHADQAIAQAEAEAQAAQARATEAYSQSVGLILELARLTSLPDSTPSFAAAAATKAASIEVAVPAPAAEVLAPPQASALPAPALAVVPAPSPTKEELRQKRVLKAQASKVAAAHKSVCSLEVSLSTVQTQVKTLEDALASRQQASELVEARETELQGRLAKAEAAATAKVKAAVKRQHDLEQKREALEQETARLRSELATSSESRAKAEAAAVAAEAKAESERVSAAQAVAAAAIESKAAAAEAAAAHALSSVAQAFQLHSELSRNSGSTTAAAAVASVARLPTLSASPTAPSPATDATTSAATSTTAAATATTEASPRTSAFSTPPPWEQRQSSYRLTGNQVHEGGAVEGEGQAAAAAAAAEETNDKSEEESLVEAAVSFLDVPWDSDAAAVGAGAARGVGRISNEGTRNAFSASRPRSMVGMRPTSWQSYDNRFGVGRRSYLIDATLRSSG